MNETQGMFVKRQRQEVSKLCSQDLDQEYYRYSSVNQNETGCQANVGKFEKDKVVCTCKHIPRLGGDHTENVLNTSKRIKDSFADIGVGNVVAFKKRRVKKIYLPSTEDKGVGSSFVADIKKISIGCQGPCNNIYKTMSTENLGNTIPYAARVINQTLSPIVHTKSRTTSPRSPNLVIEPLQNYAISIKTNTMSTDPRSLIFVVEAQNPVHIDTSKSTAKKLVTVSTQFEDLTQKPTEHKFHLVVDDKTKEIHNKSNLAETVMRIDEIKELKIQNIADKNNDSSDSLLQRVHDLESNVNDTKQSVLSIDPMENRIEQEYRKIFTPNASKDQKTSEKLSENTSAFKRRFEALRRGLKRDDSKRNSTMSNKISNDDYSHKDASIISDPPSLESRSYSSGRKSKVHQNETEYFNTYEDFKKQPKNEKVSAEDSENSEISQGVKGMFKLWGKKFNFEDDNLIQNSQTKPNTDIILESNKGHPKMNDKKEKKKFFFFKRKTKKEPTLRETDLKEPTEIYKKKVITARCEIRNGFMISIGNRSNIKKPAVKTKTLRKTMIPLRQPLEVVEESNEEILGKLWLTQYIHESIEPKSSVKIRWDNRTYKTSSSTIFELLDNVYKSGVVFSSQSEILSNESSSYKAYKNHFIRQRIHAWMIPNMIRDIQMKTSATIRDAQPEKRNHCRMGSYITNQKSFIDNSKAFSQKVAIILDTKRKSLRSSEYLKINLSKGCSYDNDNSPKHPNEKSSDEEVYNVIEYEEIIEKSSKKLKDNVKHDGDHLQNHTVEEVIQASPVKRNVVIQESDVYVPKRCAVFIITQRDLIDDNKPKSILDDYTEEDDSDIKALPKTCEVAQNFFQEYYKLSLPVAVDTFSWCSDSYVVGGSEDASYASIKILNQGGDVTKSCPNIYESYHTITGSTETSLCTPPSPCPCGNYQGLQKKKDGTYGNPYQGYCESQMPECRKLKHRKDQCKLKIKQCTEIRKMTGHVCVAKNDFLWTVLPKDSLEVFKKRKLYSASKAKWTDKPECPTQSVPSNEDKAVMKNEIMKKGILSKFTCNDYEKRTPDGILDFDSKCRCTECKKKKHCGMKHSVKINPTPTIRRDPACIEECTKKNSKPPCSKHSPSCFLPPCRCNKIEPCSPIACPPNPCKPKPCPQKSCPPKPCPQKFCPPEPCPQKSCQPESCSRKPCQPEPCLPKPCPPAPCATVKSPCTCIYISPHNSKPCPPKITCPSFQENPLRRRKVQVSEGSGPDGRIANYCQTRTTSDSSSDSNPLNDTKIQKPLQTTTIEYPPLDHKIPSPLASLPISNQEQPNPLASPPISNLEQPNPTASPPEIAQTHSSPPTSLHASPSNDNFQRNSSPSVILALNRSQIKPFQTPLQQQKQIQNSPPNKCIFCDELITSLEYVPKSCKPQPPLPSINIKASPFTEETREGIKVKDDDGKSIYDKVVKKSKKHESILGCFNQQNLNFDRMTIKNTDSDQIEIEFQLKLKHGDRNAEIKVAHGKPTDVCKKTITRNPQKVYVVQDKDDERDENPKNDINIRIVVKNIKSQQGVYDAIEKETPNLDSGIEFSRRISEKFGQLEDNRIDKGSEISKSFHEANCDICRFAKRDKKEMKTFERISTPLTSSLSVVSCSKKFTDQDYEVVRDVACHDQEVNQSDAFFEDVLKSYSIHRATIDLSGSLKKSTSHMKNKKELIGHAQIHFTTNQTETKKSIVETSDGNKFEQNSSANIENMIQSKKWYDEPSRTSTSNTDTDDQNNTNTSDDPTTEIRRDALARRRLSKEEKKNMLETVFGKASLMKTDPDRMKKLRNVLKLILSSNESSYTGLSAANKDNITFDYVDKQSAYYTHNTESLANYPKDNFLCLKDTNSSNNVTRNVVESQKDCCCSNNNTCLCSGFGKNLNMCKENTCCCNSKKNYEYKSQEISCDFESTEDSSLSMDICVASLGTKLARNNKKVCTSKEVSAHFIAPVIPSVNKSKKSIKTSNINYCKEMLSKKLITRTKISKANKMTVLQPKCFSIETRFFNDPADILQSYETKKAVLDIYAKSVKTDKKKMNIAELPKFVNEKRSEVERNYDKLFGRSRNSTNCKTSFIMMTLRE